MAIRHNTEAFIIKTKNRGEADQAITFYTERFGKIEVFCKGIRRINSKLRGKLSLADLLYIEFIETLKRKTLVDAEPVSVFLKTKKNPEKMEISSRIKEKLDMAIKEEEKSDKAWEFLKEVFKELEKTKNWALLYYYFLWNISRISGYGPDLQHCCFCNKEIDFKNSLFCPDGGFSHKECAKKAVRLPEDSMKLIKFFFNNSAEKTTRVKAFDPSCLKKASEDWFFSQISVL